MMMAWNLKKFNRIATAATLSLSVFVSSLFPGGVIDGSRAVHALPANENPTMMQYFEWELPNDGQHWNRLSADAAHLKSIGVNMVWLPPAYKGGGSADVGYGVYDGYDLGEFNQKGTIRTKYGTKAQLQTAISQLHNQGIDVLMDMILNHRGNGDRQETVSAVPVSSTNRNYATGAVSSQVAYTAYDFSGRGSQYSTFKWNATHFNGFEKNGQIYRIADKGWDWEVDTENGNFDYLLMNDIDYDNPAVVQEMKNWGTWMVNTLGVDGFRVDAAKHFKFSFMQDWIQSVRTSTGKPLFTVAEYLTGNTGAVMNYLNKTGNTFSAFDFQLHYQFYGASNGGGAFDMRQLLPGSLVSQRSGQAVTIVDNHDTQPGQAIESFVQRWFKPIAYATILTREQGIPCIFYGDYYGIPTDGILPLQSSLDPLIRARKQLAYGKQNDYIDHWDVIGWSREGDQLHPDSGLATIVSDGPAGTKWMYVGTHQAGETWVDVTGNRSDQIVIGSNGWAEFKVNGGSVSVWAKESMKYTDTFAPSAPGQVQLVSKGNAVNTVTWTASSDDSGDVRYELYRNQLKIAEPLTNTFVDRGVVPGTAYQYQVVAVDGSGNRTNSAGAALVVNSQAPISGQKYVYLYYKRGFTPSFAHFRPAGGVWTTAPGWEMINSEYAGWARITLPIGTASQAEICFNNATTWDSNGGLNYFVNAGTFSYSPNPGSGAGTFTAGNPAGPLVTPTPVVTSTPVVTATPVVTGTPTPFVTPTPIVTVTPVVTGSPTPVASATPGATGTPTPTPVVTSTPTSAPIYGENVLTNPGFENGDWKGWYAWSPAGQPPALGVDQNDAYAGKYKAYFWRESSYMQSIHQVSSGLANGEYELSLRVKMSAFGGIPRTARIEVSEHGGAPIFVSFNATGKWTSVKLPVTINTGKADIGVFLDSPGKTSLQLDDLSFRRLLSGTSGSPEPTSTPSITPVPTVTPTATPDDDEESSTSDDDLLENSGFENADFKGWTQWHPNGQTSALGVDKNDSKNGNYKAYFWKDQPFMQSIHQVKTNLKSGSYELSVWVKLSAYGGTPRAARLEITEHGNAAIYQTLSANGQWTNYKVPFSVTSGKVDFGIFVDSPGKTSLQIDDVKLKFMGGSGTTPGASVTPGPTGTPVVTSGPTQSVPPTATPDPTETPVVTTEPTATPDVMAPDIPMDLTIAYQSDKTVRLTWKPYQPGSEVLTYQLERNGQLIATTKMLVFEDTGLTAATAYAYRVRATDEVGNLSGFSPVTAVTTDPLNKPEITIYYKSGFATPYIHYKLDNGRWTSWPGVAMSEAEIAGFYKITIPAGTSQGLESCFTNGKSQFDCKSGSNYKFKLGIATFQYLNGSSIGTIALGAPVTVVTPPPSGDTLPPAVPVAPKEEEVGRTYIKMKWSAATDNVGVTSYAVYRNGVEIAQVTGLLFTDTGLVKDTYYTYRIQAIDASGNRSPLSKSMTKKTKD